MGAEPSVRSRDVSLEPSLDPGSVGGTAGSFRYLPEAATTQGSAEPSEGVGSVSRLPESSGAGSGTAGGTAAASTSLGRTRLVSADVHEPLPPVAQLLRVAELLNQNSEVRFTDSIRLIRTLGIVERRAEVEQLLVQRLNLPIELPPVLGLAELQLAEGLIYKIINSHNCLLGRALSATCTDTDAEVLRIVGTELAASGLAGTTGAPSSSTLSKASSDATACERLRASLLALRITASRACNPPVLLVASLGASDRGYGYLPRLSDEDKKTADALWAQSRLAVALLRLPQCNAAGHCTEGRRRRAQLLDVVLNGRPGQPLPPIPEAYVAEVYRHLYCEQAELPVDLNLVYDRIDWAISNSMDTMRAAYALICRTEGWSPDRDERIRCLAIALLVNPEGAETELCKRIAERIEQFASVRPRTEEPQPTLFQDVTGGGQRRAHRIKALDQLVSVQEETSEEYARRRMRAVDAERKASALVSSARATGTGSTAATTGSTSPGLLGRGAPSISAMGTGGSVGALAESRSPSVGAAGTAP